MSRYRPRASTSRKVDKFKMPATYSRQNVPFKLFASTVTGFIFGVALEKGRVFEPIIIRQQMLMSNFTMMKMFLSACASGMLAFSVLSMIPATCVLMEKATAEFVKALGNKRASSAALGGILLGTGMTISGACPGMVLVQVGAAVPNALYTFLGTACGAFLYAFTENSAYFRRDEKGKAEHPTLDDYLETPHFNLALPMAALLGTLVFALDIYAPWATEVEVYGEGIMGIRAWPPYVAGTIVGLLQIPTVLLIGDTLGTSTGIMAIAAQSLVIPGFQKIGGHLKKFKTGSANWWQVFFMMGAVGGAFVSSTLSNTRGSVGGVHPLFAFSGGVLLIYGSRLAGGCTSGHGLSGMGLMALLSFVAVPAMFGAGITTAFVMKYGLGINIDHL
ncbi:hypothetical protein EGW08_018181 [Elysia chlorotica]|uniref:Uncharacterized protein n=1 Tax=Elysia chlorotica TaxID=188477 RepID=A0A433SXM2_ELYCH|nr:hypothetical protein EGW08_018181 [Elysia chlorotica]